MATIRGIRRISSSKPTLEGAGVHLNRAFGFSETHLYDPFLLLDDFRSDIPEHYRKGFPWHPHRGIETITYVLTGNVEHRDSLGNTGILSDGDVQWMTAGSGIIHQEMPQGNADGQMYGFQLWLNLPASTKMQAPRYEDIRQDKIPKIQLENGIQISVICGTIDGITGPGSAPRTEPLYLDITLPSNTAFSINVDTDRTAFAYVIGGSGFFSELTDTFTTNRQLVLFGEGDTVQAQAGENGFRFLLLSGVPLREPIAWHGPIVMNTEEELEQAFTEYQNGTFLK